MADAPTPATPPVKPGIRDDTASRDPLIAGLEAVKGEAAGPDGSDIAADDVGATAMAEKLDEARKDR